MDLRDSPIYLKNSVSVRASSVSEIERLQPHSRQRRRYYGIDTAPLRNAVISQIKWDNGALWYAEVSGGVVNVGAASGDEVVVGVAVGGEVTAYLNWKHHVARKPGGLIVLPGDLAIQRLIDARIFTVRLPLGRDAQISLKARSFRSRLQISRSLADDDCLDLMRLITFAALEFDRRRKTLISAEHVHALGHMLVERATACLDRTLGLDSHADPAMLRICLECDEVLMANPESKYSVEELASIVSCSVRHLYRSFEAVGQTTPADYQLRTRLNFGRSLLAAEPPPGRSLTRIALQCGFGSATRFSEAYEAEFDETPIETRRKLTDLLALLT